MQECVLELHAVSKTFPGVQALDGVSFELRRGEIHALIGENGAGKSTLIKIVTGVHQPDAGTIVLRGETVSFADPLAAQRRGIAAIYQEPTVFPELTVAENVFMGHPIVASFLRRIDWKAMYSETCKLLEDLETGIDPRTPMKALNVAERQLVEVAKALSARAEILIMDEPTSALTLEETRKLFTIMRRLRSGGTSIIFVSHRLDEVFELSDRVTILRDGRHITTCDMPDVSQEQVIQMMVGRHVGDLYPSEHSGRGEEVLRVQGLTRRGEFRDISFEVHCGEIVGLAGLVGAGRTEVARTVFGITAADTGKIFVDRRQLATNSPEDALESGIAYLPEDRQQHGLILQMSIAENITLSLLRRFLLRMLDREQEEKTTREYVHLLDIRTAGTFQRVSQLSGGNQQKTVLAKWLATRPKVLILDEPTKGIDVQAKAAVHRLMSRLAGQGLGIVMISSELPEILGMSDRIIVMHEGRITARFTRGEADQEKVLMAAIGRVEQAEGESAS
jgi:rhamnose transport system ATP-binding protein